MAQYTSTVINLYIFTANIKFNLDKAALLYNIKFNLDKAVFLYNLRTWSLVSE